MCRHDRSRDSPAGSFSSIAHDGWEVDGSDDTRGDLRRSIEAYGKDEQVVTDGERLAGILGCGDAGQQSVERLFLDLVLISDVRGTHRKPEQGECKGERGCRPKMAEGPVGQEGRRNGNAEADRDDEAGGEHSASEACHEEAEKGIGNQDGDGGGLCVGKERFGVGVGAGGDQAAEPTRLNGRLAIRADLGQDLDDDDAGGTTVGSERRVGRSFG